MGGVWGGDTIVGLRVYIIYMYMNCVWKLYIYGYNIHVYMQMYTLMRRFFVSNGGGMGRGHRNWIAGVYHIYVYGLCV